MVTPERSGATLSFEISSGEELARLAFDQKVEESGMRVLRHRLYPLVAVISALLSTFGIGLTWWVNKVAQRAEVLNTDIARAQKDLKGLNDDIAVVQNAARELRLKREELDLAMTDVAERGKMVQKESTAAITTAAGAQANGIAARDLALHAQDELSNVLREIKAFNSEWQQTVAGVKHDANEVSTNAQAIQDIRGKAEKFAKDVAEHRKLVAATVADSLTLHSNDSADVDLPKLTGSGSYKITFETGSIQRRKVFEVAYRINGGDRHVVKVSRDETRHPLPLEGTNGEYQFAIEFIYSGVIVRDFITFRVVAVPTKEDASIGLPPMKAQRPSGCSSRYLSGSCERWPNASITLTNASDLTWMSPANGCSSAPTMRIA